MARLYLGVFQSNIAPTTAYKIFAPQQAAKGGIFPLSLKPSRVANDNPQYRKLRKERNNQPGEKARFAEPDGDGGADQNNHERGERVRHFVVHPDLFKSGCLSRHIFVGNLLAQLLYCHGARISVVFREESGVLPIA